jgi:small subunit ribosomal protein S2
MNETDSSAAGSNSLGGNSASEGILAAAHPLPAPTDTASLDDKGRQGSTVRGGELDPSKIPAPRDPIDFSVPTLLEAGAHFGHQTERWNPKMLPFLYGKKNGVHIINLDFTVRAFAKARKFIIEKVQQGGTVLFVGTKIQTREVVETEARRCGSNYITTRWLGGTLTNFSTVRNAIERMKKLEDLLVQANTESSGVKLNKLERLRISRELGKLDASIGGIRTMRRIPDLLIVVDVNKEAIAIAEADRLGIPVVALVDSNADPEVVKFPVPCNDDSARAVRLFVGAVSDAISEGKLTAQQRPVDESNVNTSQRSHGRHRGGRDRDQQGGQRGDRRSAAH